MIYAKEVNIANTINVPYLQSATGNFDIKQKSYINYNNEKWIGGSEPYTTGAGFVVSKIPTANRFNPGAIGDSGFYICYYDYDWDTNTWSQVDDVINAKYIRIRARTYSVWNFGQVDFIEDNIFTDRYINLVTVYNDTNVSYHYISTNVDDAKLNIQPGQPYSKDELDTQIDSRFYSFPNIRTKLKTNNLYGGIITSKTRCLEFLSSGQWGQDNTTWHQYSFRQCATQQGGSWYTTGKPPCFNDDAVFMNYRTNLPIIILFASDEEYKAAMCVYTQWPQAPYYPIS